MSGPQVGDRPAASARRPPAARALRADAPTPRREQERTKRTKRAILESALPEFARHGFEGASTRRIAEAAGITSALIGHHFGNKDALWKAVAADTFERFVERLGRRQAGLEGVDDWNLLRLMLREYLLFFSEEPDFFRFVFHANQGDSDRLGWLVDNYMAPAGKRYMALLGRAQAAGWIIEGDLYSLRYLFWGAAGWMFACDRAFRRIAGRDPFDPAFIDEHVDLVLRLFLRPGAKAPDPREDPRGMPAEPRSPALPGRLATGR